VLVASGDRTPIAPPRIETDNPALSADVCRFGKDLSPYTISVRLRLPNKLGVQTAKLQISDGASSKPVGEVEVYAYVAGEENDR
jgi:hypothetical protein